MNQKEPQQFLDVEISFISIFLFFKSSGGNIVKSSLVCLLAGGANYFSTPAIYEATSTIEIAKLAGETVEAPVVLLERMKLPFFFSPATFKACGIGNEINAQGNFGDKIKLSINKLAPSFLSLSSRATTSQEAKACLNSAVADIASYQDSLAKPLVEQKKETLLRMSEQLKLFEEINKSYSDPKFIRNLTSTGNNNSVLFSAFIFVNNNLANELKLNISKLKLDLLANQTHLVNVVSPAYASGVPINKRPLLTLGSSLAFGVLLGLLITGAMRFAPEMLRQVRRYEGGAR